VYDAPADAVDDELESLLPRSSNEGGDGEKIVCLRAFFKRWFCCDGAEVE